MDIPLIILIIGNILIMENSTQSFLHHCTNSSLIDILQNHPFDHDTNSTIKPSHFYNSEQLKTLISEKSSYSIATLNCQSINAKHSQIEILIDSLNANSFEVLSLQETWLEHGVDATLLQLPNYDLVWRGASTSRHGGVGFYIKNTLKYSILPQSHNSNIWESMFIRIESSLLPQSIIIGSIYRPPSQLQADKITFIEELSQILNTLQHHSHLPIILTGDFNFDLLKLHHNDTITQFYNSITSLGFDPQITLPTRTTDTSHTLIDNIFTNSFTTSSPISGILTSPISDHQLCFMRFNVKNLNLNNKYITIKNRPHNLHELIKTDLQNMNIMQQMDHNPDTDPSHNYTIIHNAISSTIDKHTTTKTVKFNKHKHKKSEWITQGLIRSIRYRDKLHLKMKRTHPDSPQRNTLKTNIATYNKILKKTIRQAKALHYNNIFTQAHNNPKDTWKAINNTLNRNTKTDTNIEYLIDNDRKITAPKEIADHLNTFFTNIGHKIASQIPPSDTTIDTYLQPINAPPFDFHPITQTDIDQIIRKLKPKHSTGHDDINTILIKTLHRELCQPLTLIINQMIATSIFPNSLKIAKIKPLYKKGNRHLCENYRPISLLPAISKILEKTILKQLDHHFSTNNLYYKSQYGFRHKHSTEHALLELTDRLLTSMDKNDCPTSIFIDLTKAFDCLNHNILIHKLKHYNLQDKAIALCKNYLTHRQQYITLQNTTSNHLNINTGVPQGSILGPFLFLIYINDLPNSSSSIDFITYADDTTLITSLNSNFSTNSLNNELNNVFKWFCTNKLSLNATKTNSITFHTPQRKITPPDLYINSHKIQNVDHTNFLGIIIDKHLSFKPHINKVNTKISQITGILNRLKHQFPQHILLTIYQSLIIPHITYGALTWSKSHHIHTLIKQQKKAIRTITKSKYNAHTEPLFKQTNLLKIEDLRKLLELKFYYKWKSGVLPNYFSTFISAGRGDDRLRVPLHRHQFFQLGLRYSITNTVNPFPRHLLSYSSTHSIASFSKRIKSHFINQYSYQCLIENCYVCNNQN
jgi:hypothetical protein